MKPLTIREPFDDRENLSTGLVPAVIGLVRRKGTFYFVVDLAVKD